MQRSTSASLLFLFMAANSLMGGDELATIKTLCDKFEQARVKVDAELANKLILPTAVGYQANGRETQPLLAGIEFWSSRRTTGTAFEAVRVLDRQITLHDSLAIVHELLGAAANVEAGNKIKPRRRTLVWIKRDGVWRLADLHASDYSRWENAIAAYEAQDEEHPVEPGGIVFVGSSSIRGWRTLATDFPNLPVIGRGFGGSQLIDSVMYAHRIVTKYRPSAVAIYAGDNDIANGKSPERVYSDFKTLAETIHHSNPDIRIGFIAIKPSLSRWRMWDKMHQANQMVVDHAQQDPRVTFLDIATPMLRADGTPNPELFVKDGLHLNRKGYELWTKVVSPWANER